MGPPAKRLFGLYRIAGSNPVPPAYVYGLTNLFCQTISFLVFLLFLLHLKPRNSCAFIFPTPYAILDEVDTLAQYIQSSEFQTDQFYACYSLHALTAARCLC
jgi:hypothetical protein